VPTQVALPALPPLDTDPPFDIDPLDPPVESDPLDPPVENEPLLPAEPPLPEPPVPEHCAIESAQPSLPQQTPLSQ
jgi:hypothetical protein